MIITKTKNKSNLMKTLLDQESFQKEENSLIEGSVINIDKSSIFIDLRPIGTGIIYGKEFSAVKEIIRKMKVGDIVKAKIMEAENENGYIELSLKEARQALIWNEAEKAIKEKTLFNLVVKDANKGGLILEWKGIQGFLPASQLRPEHYPRVEDSNRDEILKELKKLIDEKLKVTIMSVLSGEDKLIFSEKENDPKEQQIIIEKYSIGDELEGEVAGIVDFGIFLKIEEGLEGLVHISEIDWGLIDDPRSIFKIGEKTKAKIIEIKDGKISLSLKSLKENPWKEFEGKLKKGDIIKGVIIKFNKYGALVSIKEGVAGLVHHSSFGSEERLREKLELGKTYNFQITLFEPKEQRMTLTFLENNKEG